MYRGDMNSHLLILIRINSSFLFLMGLKLLNYLFVFTADYLYYSTMISFLYNQRALQC